MIEEDEALLEAQRQIAQLRKKIRKLEHRLDASRQENNYLLEKAGQNATYGGSKGYSYYHDVWGQIAASLGKAERQRQTILNIQASPRGSKYWVAEYVIEEQQSLQEALGA